MTGLVGSTPASSARFRIRLIKSISYLFFTSTEKHDYFEAYSNLGSVLVELRQFDSAYVNYEKAINLNEDYDLALLGLGSLLLRKGRYIEGLNKLRLAAGSIFFNIKKGYSVKNRGIK